MSKALVTGGTGFIGSHVIRVLLKQGIQVRCLARVSSNRRNLAGLNVEFVTGDLNDARSLKMAVDGCDWLFHVAADYRLWVRDAAAMEQVNVEGTRHLFEAAAAGPIRRIIFTSSVAAVGRPIEKGRLGIGNETLDPSRAQLIGPYKRSKYAADRLARDLAAQGYPIVIVNPSTPVGDYDIKPTPTGKLIVDFLNRRMPGYLKTGLNFVDVHDVAVGHWLAAEKGVVGERYILGNRNLSLKGFLYLLSKLSGLPPPRFRIPYGVAWLAGAISTGFSYFTHQEPAIPLDGVRMAHEPMYYDASKAVRELGFPQTPVEQALVRAIEWFRANGYVKRAL